MSSLTRTLLGLLVATGLTACERPGSETVSKDGGSGKSSKPVKPSSPSEKLPSGHPPAGTDSGGSDAALTKPPEGFDWEVPDGWEAGRSSQMRAGSFKVSGDGDQTASISVIPLAAQSGSLRANVNRWRGQIGLDPVKKGQIDKLTKSIQIAGSEGVLVDFKGPGTTGGGGRMGLPAGTDRIVVATAEIGNRQWFFKMAGPKALVEKQKDTFLDFVRSFERTGS